MNKLIIIGAGGMGRTMYDLAKESIGFAKDFEIKGFLDDNLNALDTFEYYPPVIGTIKDYIPQNNEVFVCSIGGHSRQACIEKMLEKGAEFIPLIHKTARIGTNVRMGKGTLVGTYTTIAADAELGDYNFIQSLTIIGHDCKIGSWNRIDSQVMMVGATTIGDNNMIHTGAMINHNVHIGDNCTIGAASFVTMDVESGSTLFSAPARRLK